MIEGFRRSRFGKEVTRRGNQAAALAEEIAAVLAAGGAVAAVDPARNGRMSCWWSGVNGIGKTTTIGKLAQTYREQGLRAVMVAGDTFRAAAVEQLQIWGERVGAR